jgi:hypothetical protein
VRQVLRAGDGTAEPGAGSVIDSERWIAWRASDSLADEPPPDHSTISRTRRVIDLESHRAVLTWVQQRLVAAGLLRGKSVAIDGTTLEANAAMRSIVRRDSSAAPKMLNHDFLVYARSDYVRWGVGVVPHRLEQLYEFRVRP